MTDKADLRRKARRSAMHLPVVGSYLRRDQKLREENRRLRDLVAEVDKLYVVPGHFYSPVPALAEVRAAIPTVYGQTPPTSIPEIDLRVDSQLELLALLGELVADAPFSAEPNDRFRYGYGNSNYSYADALQLHGMLRHLRPARFIEVGSGHSSCLTLDTNERYLDGSMKVTFIEPYPELLHSLVRPADRAELDVRSTGLQEINVEYFSELGAGDVLFIDSTHVSKFQSDVNHLFFNLLPSLASGVHVHIHDIFYPFEYPQDWVEQNRAWNELYLLRAFLEYNVEFEITLFGHYLETVHPEAVAQAMPLALKSRAGSIWLRKR